MSMFNRLWHWLLNTPEDNKQNPPPEPPPTQPHRAPRPKLKSAIITDSESNKNLALLAISGDLREAIIARHRKQWSKSGSLVVSGGKISSSPILSIIGAAGGSIGISAATSSQLFIATANPATLMAIGNGVGSAVVGATGGIVAQAPFIAASAAIVPVVAPLIGFQAISTFVVMRQFAEVQQALARIERKLERITHRSEATFASELFAISQRLESLEAQFRDERQFSTDMIIRLALVEERTSALLERYRLLNDLQNITQESSEVDLQFKLDDSRFAAVASSINLRAGYLRLALSIQDSPSRTKYLLEEFSSLCEEHNKLLKNMKVDSESTTNLIEELNDAVEAMNWFQRKFPRWLLGKRNAWKEMEHSIETLQSHRDGQLEIEQTVIAPAEDLGRQARNAAFQADDMTLIYWRDEFGEHSYYIEEIPFDIQHEDS